MVVFMEYLHCFKIILGVIYNAGCIIEFEVVKGSIVRQEARYVAS